MDLKLYMKSGNTMVIEHVEKWNIEYTGDRITSINITWGRGKKEGKGVILGSISLSQIEAMEAL